MGEKKLYLDKGTIYDQLTSLKEKGFRISIDNFGSESSNYYASNCKNCTWNEYKSNS